MLGNVLHHAGVQSLEQCHTLREALLEVYFSSHGPLSDGFHLVADTGTLGKFVDAFCLNER